MDDHVGTERRVLDLIKNLRGAPSDEKPPLEML
jgi:hypothetical protein